MARILFIAVSAVAVYLSILSTICVSINIYISPKIPLVPRWKRIVFNLISVVVCLAYLGLSHALLFYSIFWNRQLVEVLATWFARVLLATQVRIFVLFLKKNAKSCARPTSSETCCHILEAFTLLR